MKKDKIVAVVGDFRFIKYKLLLKLELLFGLELILLRFLSTIFEDKLVPQLLQKLVFSVNSSPQFGQNLDIGKNPPSF